MARPARPLPISDALGAGFDDALTASLAKVRGRHGASVRHLVSAVSGGPDSMALARLAGDYAARTGLSHSALVVDHGIRPESAAEAARVVSRLRSYGLAARILAVREPAPPSGLQEWARTRRYQLLLAEARRAGACLLLGHHAGDQAETVMMRLGRGSGLAGLAGMRDATIRHGVPVLRPLLSFDRAAIVAFCADHGLQVETDPSNADSRFDRVRCRLALARMDGAGLAVSDRLRQMSGMMAAIDDSLLDALHRKGLPACPGAAGELVVPDHMLALPPLALCRLLARVIRLVATPQHGPGQDALLRLGARLAAGRASTLGGGRFSRMPDGWLVTAEIGRTPPQDAVEAGGAVLFAGNWLVHSAVDATVRYLGEAGSGATAAWQDSAGWDGLPPLVRRSLPVLQTLDGELLYPHLVSHGRVARTDVMATAECLRHTSYPFDQSSQRQQSNSRRRRPLQ